MSHSQPAHLPIPSRVGNYTLLKTIGKGQFGYVKLAIHDLTRERVRAILCFQLPFQLFTPSFPSYACLLLFNL